MSAHPKDSEERRWLDDPKNVDRIVHGLYLVCALLLSIDLLDLVGLLYHKHVHFSFEKLPGFYGLYGLFGSIGLVLTAKQLRKVLMKDEDYYDR
jgi:hypothetical protein